ncbi:MAG: methyltransferase domain-containing protein, partial [bacterium]
LEAHGTEIIHSNIPERMRARPVGIEVSWRDALKQCWTNIFGDRRKVVLEIGFGSGEFLETLCVESPGMNFVGIEISRPSIERATRRLRAHRNVRLIHCDARLALRHLFRDRSIDRVHLNFPFPWDKLRHQKRRLIDQDFVDSLGRKLRRGGWFQIVSDSIGYVTGAHQVLEASRIFEVKEIPTADVLTRYRKKWEAQSRDIHGLRAVKRKEPQAEKQRMDDLLRQSAFSLPASLDEIYEGFRPAVITVSPTLHIRIKQIYRKGHEGLIEALIVEGQVKEEVLLRLGESEARLELAPYPEAAPFTVRQMNQALDAIVEHLKIALLKKKIPELLQSLESAYGRRGWWPHDAEYHRRHATDPREEILIGAILTQNTAWTNVEKAIQNLKSANALSLKAIAEMNESRLADLLRPSGYFRAKAKKLKAFAEFVERRWGEDLNQTETLSTEELRKALLSIWGIGPETADSIVLYAFNRPVIVVDAYTQRIVQRLAMTNEKMNYADCQALFLEATGAEPYLYQEYHALLVEHAKRHCTSGIPRCTECPVLSMCAFGRNEVNTQRLPASV